MTDSGAELGGTDVEAEQLTLIESGDAWILRGASGTGGLVLGGLAGTGGWSIKFRDWWSYCQ